jgi:hypothetical protein
MVASSRFYFSFASNLQCKILFISFTFVQFNIVLQAKFSFILNHLLHSSSFLHFFVSERLNNICLASYSAKHTECLPLGNPSKVPIPAFSHIVLFLSTLVQPSVLLLLLILRYLTVCNKPYYINGSNRMYCRY